MAYRQGIFPMTMEDGEIGWFRPYTRAVFPMDGIRVSRSLARTIRRGKFEVRFDTSFEAVMRGCLRPEENWISEEFVRVYGEAYRQGWGHCSEAWHDGRLVGGVYGLAIGGCFFAESMFYRERDASKVALWALVEQCRELGFTLFDAQIQNPHLESLGAIEVTDYEFQTMLEKALATPTAWGRI